MTYTQETQTGKRFQLILKRFRSQIVRLWLRCAGPRWTVGSLAFLRRADDGRVCLLKHKGRVKPWGLPGGLVAWPESPESGLRRELNEELRWTTQGTNSPDVNFQIVQTCVSENFSMVELVFEANRRVSAQECAAWIPQASEITEIAWFSADEIERLEGLLERHRSLLLRLLHRS